MIDEIRMFTWGHFIKFWLGGLFGTRAKVEKANVISVSELERLELLRKLREEHKAKKFSRADIAIEDIVIRKW